MASDGESSGAFPHSWPKPEYVNTYFKTIYLSIVTTTILGSSLDSTWLDEKELDAIDSILLSYTSHFSW